MTNYNPDYSVHPGETLREMLKERGWSQTDLSKRIGLSRHSINRLVNGKRKMTNMDVLYLSLVFDVSIDFWIDRIIRYDKNKDPNRRIK